MQSNKQPSRIPKSKEEASPAATFFIVVIVTGVLMAVGSIVLLQENVWVAGQKLWLVSRAAAIAAYLVLTIVVVLGILLSHPRNKDSWRWTPFLLPWHQALIATMFSLIGLHLFFTGADPKSGITWSGLLFPLHARYHPMAMMAGAAGLYSLILVGATAGLRKWTRQWLPVHRLSWIVWLFIFAHGFLGGTDAVALRPLYIVTGVIVFLGFFTRHWTSTERRRTSLSNERDAVVENANGGMSS